jgi:hypothetical protein
LVELVGPGQRLTPEVSALAREQRRAHRRSIVGGALFALGLWMALTGIMASIRVC